VKDDYAEPSDGLATTGTSANSTAPDQIAFKPHEYRLATEVLYHGARQHFLMGCHRWAMFCTILFGAGAASTFFSPAFCGLAAVMFGAADIAFDFTGRAQIHATFRRLYLELGRKIKRGEIPESEFEAEWMLISTDEPPVYRYVELIAAQNACAAFRAKYNGDKITFLCRLFAHFYRG